jgi:hypothetical protein
MSPLIYKLCKRNVPNVESGKKRRHFLGKIKLKEREEPSVEIV